MSTSPRPASTAASIPLAPLPASEGFAFPPLPVSLTALVGRDREAAAVLALLRRPGVRLVTLTGPGGVGKTRLALRIAGEPDADLGAAAFVPLAPISDPTLVVPTIARHLGIVDATDAPPLDRIAAALGTERCLLILDNVEQLIDAAPLVVDLLAACPRLTLLITSRTVLRVSGEHDYPVPPLPLADPEGRASPAELADIDAIRLFLDRARTVDPGLAPTAANLTSIAAICDRLDGLPLAIELAAARANLLPPPALLARLDQRLSFLTGGSRDLPDRLRTMRGAIDWSHDLLSPAEQARFRRLAVFSGGFTLDAAEAVAGDISAETDRTDDRASRSTAETTAALDSLGSLVDQSLVRRTESTASHAADSRFALLETLREYALERLAASGEEAAVRRAHAAHFLALAEQTKAALKGPTEAASLDRLEADHDNLRVAFDWLLDETPASALRLGLLLARFWAFRGYGREGFDRMERALARADGAPTQDRARASNEAGALAEELGRFDRAETLYRDALRIWQGLDDEEGASKALDYLGYLAQLRGEPTQAIAWHEQALASARASGNPRVIRTVRVNLASALVGRGDIAAAASLLEESLTEARAANDPYMTSVVLNDLGTIALRQGDHARAIACHEESLRFKRDLGHASGIAEALLGLGQALVFGGEVERGATLIAEAVDRHRALGDPHRVAVAQLHLGRALQRLGDDRLAGTLVAEALSAFQRLGDRASLAEAIEEAAWRGVRRGAWAAAARLGGAAAALWASTGAARESTTGADHDRALATTRSKLGDDAFAAAWAAGDLAPLDEIVAEAIAETLTPSLGRPPSAEPGAGPARGLTGREQEVLRLVAAGLPDREIAAALALSTRTVEWHVANLLAKLDLDSRSAAAAFAVRHGLA